MWFYIVSLLLLVPPEVRGTSPDRSASLLQMGTSPSGLCSPERVEELLFASQGLCVLRKKSSYTTIPVGGHLQT
eukprot:720817-Prorocentrum_minimum.AAC.2